MRKIRSTDPGFSMLELLIALSISAILLALAIPSLQSLAGDSEISSSTNDFVYSLQMARSEAIKRAGPVGLCPSAAPLADNPSCSTGSYAQGWIVFFDANSNGSREAGDEVIVQTEALSAAFTVTADQPLSQRVYFGETGSSMNPAGIPLSGTIRIDYAGGNEKRDVIIAATGRISTKVVP